MKQRDSIQSLTHSLFGLRLTKVELGMVFNMKGFVDLVVSKLKSGNGFKFSTNKIKKEIFIDWKIIKNFNMSDLRNENDIDDFIRKSYEHIGRCVFLNEMLGKTNISKKIMLIFGLNEQLSKNEIIDRLNETGVYPTNYSIDSAIYQFGKFETIPIKGSNNVKYRVRNNYQEGE